MGRNYMKKKSGKSKSVEKSQETNENTHRSDSFVFCVNVFEVLAKSVYVRSRSPQEALEKVREEYKNGSIVLTADDFVQGSTKFSIDVLNYKCPHIDYDLVK
jgi:hypothetical protein